MNSDALSDREAAEHIQLLRKALRTRLVILGIFAILTWGLWAMIQAGDQKTAAIGESYDGRLSALRTKWNIPADASFNFFSENFDVISEIDMHSDPPKPVMDVVHFCTELDQLRGQFYFDLESAYTVHVKVPYLQDLVEINALTLAGCWPFALMAVIASTIVFDMRARINAIIVAWIAHSRTAISSSQHLIIFSDFMVGSLVDGGTRKRPYVIYRKALTVQPESLLVYALIGVTIYLSFAFGFFQNPANSYEMESTLGDYVALVWISLVILSSLVWVTRKRYLGSLEEYIGMPVRGRISGRLEHAANRWRQKSGRFLGRHRVPRIVVSTIEGFIGIAALVCLCLPWMNPHLVRGYEFFLSAVPNSLDEDLYWELRLQLFFVAFFVILCLIDWSGRTIRSGRHIAFLSRLRRYCGFIAAVLIGNIVFHFAMLQMLAIEESESFLIVPPWNLLARPHPLKNSSLMWVDPAYGFWMFSILCLILVEIGRRRRMIGLRRTL